MPAINVNPIRPAAWGPRDFPSSGGMNPPCGNRLRRFCGAKAPSPRGGVVAGVNCDFGAFIGGVSHACD